MKTYIITYDLNKSGQNYEGLIGAIKTYSCVHAMQSVWFVKSNSTAEGIYSHLKNYIDANDYIFIGEVNSNRQGWLPKTVWNFLDS